jgi:hypothetical protein
VQHFSVLAHYYPSIHQQAAEMGRAAESGNSFQNYIYLFILRSERSGIINNNTEVQNQN